MSRKDDGFACLDGGRIGKPWGATDVPVVVIEPILIVIGILEEWIHEDEELAVFGYFVGYIGFDGLCASSDHTATKENHLAIVIEVGVFIHLVACGQLVVYLVA